MNDKVAILGCAKNCAKYLPSTMSNIHKICLLFKDYHIFLYENDSDDGTNKLVREYNNHPKVTGQSFVSVKYKYPLRTWCIAHARNTLLKTLYKSNFKPDYVIVMDMDDIGAQQNFKGLNFIKKALNLKEHWDGIFPQCSYDYWAYRIPGCILNYLQIVNELSSYQNYIKQKLSTLKYDENNLTPIYSGFNGMAIYKYDLYIKGVYSGENMHFSASNYINNNIKNIKVGGVVFKLFNEAHNQECEHVNFHKSLGPCRLMMCKDIQYP